MIKYQISKSFSKPDYLFVEMKKRFDINQESGSYSVSYKENRIASNRSSFNYNIINGQVEKEQRHIVVFWKKLYLIKTIY